jgi:mitotic spindle assembly checkpoint protein MAD2
MACKVEKLILAIKSKETMTVLERWQFDIHNTKDLSSNFSATTTTSTDPFSRPLAGQESISTTATSSLSSPSKPKPEKTEKEIQTEIQAILRQITASVSFLPMLDEKCKQASTSGPSAARFNFFS